MKRKTPARYTDGELYLCCGGVLGPKRIDIDPESLKGENLKLEKWYRGLPQDGGYRFRAGFFGGKLWAEVSIEFKNFCDAAVPWSYVRKGPGNEAGKVIKRTDRRPEVSLYWAHLDRCVRRCNGSMEILFEEPKNGTCWHMSKKPLASLGAAMRALQRVQKDNPRSFCTLEKFDSGQIVVATRSRDHGRMTRQVDVSLPISPFASHAEIRNRINAFLVELGEVSGTSPAERLQIAKGMRWTVVNVI